MHDPAFELRQAADSASRTTWAWARRCRRSRCCSIARRSGRRSWSRRRRSCSTGRRGREVRAVAERHLVSDAGRPRRRLTAGHGRRAGHELRPAHVATRSGRRRCRFATVVLDEAQAVKNAATQRARGGAQSRRGVPGRAVGHADGEPPRRAVEPVSLRGARPVRQLGSVPRSVRGPDRARQG